MSTLKNNRLLRAARREPVDMTPIWIMRQAGRYLPEYRATRQVAGSFMGLCTTPELACEVTLQPLARFNLDAAIIFSDILTIPDAMGLGLSFKEGSGPQFKFPLHDTNAIQRLQAVDLEKLTYVYDAIRLVKHELAGKVPLIGFCGSPWTLAAYMVQGASSPGFPLLMALYEQAPSTLHHLLALLATSVTQHLIEQIAAGADVVMLFDTWGGLLCSQPAYEEFSLRYLKQIINGIHQHYNDKNIPIILFTKNGSQWIEVIADSGCDVVGLDWQITLEAARQKVGHKVTLQGNLHPDCLLETPEKIYENVKTILASFGTGPGHIFNLGHGITPAVPPENVAVLVDAVHELSAPYHAKGGL